MIEKQIRPELYQTLTKLDGAKQALDAATKHLMDEARKMHEQYMAEQKKVWQTIAQETGIDLMKTDWAPSSEKPNTIIMIQQRFFA